MTKETRRSKDKTARAAHIANLLHQRLAHERSQSAAIERAAHLRSLLGLPPTPPPPETDPERRQ
jgi:hypothetical protein